MDNNAADEKTAFNLIVIPFKIIGLLIPGNLRFCCFILSGEW